MTSTCPSCGAGYALADQLVGREIACKRCGDTLRVTAAGLESRKAPTHTVEGDFEGLVSRPPRRGVTGASAGSVRDYLTFRRMIVPILIQIIFWVLTGLCLLIGLFTILKGLTNPAGVAPIELVVQGLVLIFLGPLLVRIHCELIIVFFRILDALNAIRDSLQRDRPVPPPMDYEN